MPRKPFQCDPNSPYHVFNRCINKDWFGQPMDQVWNILCTYLWFVQNAYELRVHAFVLMGNHFHILISAPKGNLSEAMRYFMSMTSRELVKAADRINHTYAHRFGRCRIGTYNYYLNAYKYILYNPVKAGLVNCVESYPYSSIGATIGGYDFGVVIEDEVLFKDIRGTIEWLNKNPNSEYLDLIGKALRRKNFKYSGQQSKKLNFWEDDII